MIRRFNWTIAACWLAFAVVCWSFLGGFSDAEIERHSVKHVVTSGDTLFGIAEKYYWLNQNGMCFNEFYYNVGADNKHLANNRRYLQIGDVVTVNYYTITKN